MNSFVLALGVEAKQPMDQTIPRTRGTHREGSKEAERWQRNVKRGSTSHQALRKCASKL